MARERSPFPSVFVVLSLLSLVNPWSDLGAVTPGKSFKPSDSDLAAMSLESLLNLTIEAPTKFARPLRETPAVATLITREEIVRSGARDLIDVLNMVPGFFFGVDVFGAVGLGFRGIWGHEGKILLLLDGQEMNETLYMTTVYGNHYPVDLIERIEIIRGPGSVIYGGTAELAVINIVSRTPENLDGVAVTAKNGQMGGTNSRSSISLYAGHVFDKLDDLSVSLSLSMGDGIRSDDTYVDPLGGSYSLTDNWLDPRMLNLGVSWKGFESRVLFDVYDIGARDAFFDIARAPLRGLHKHFSYHGSYKWRLSDNFELTPHVSYKHQTPYQTNNDPFEDFLYDKKSEKYDAGMTANWNFTENGHLLSGVEMIVNQAHFNTDERIGERGQVLFADGTTDDFRTLGVFSEVQLFHRIANFSVGARYEYNDRFGDAFVPRASLTRVFDKFHLKLLFSQAFRAPGHENYGLNRDLEPERTTALELETGYQLTDNVFIAANLFDITIKDPIIFFIPDTDDTGNYINSTQTGSRGIELEYRMKYSKWYGALRYSYYTADGKNEVGLYEVPGKSDLLRGFPANKVMFDGRFDFTKRLSLNPSIAYFDVRYGTQETGELGREDPTWLVNLFFHAEDVLVEGLTFTAGVHNLLDEDFRFLQPYDGGHAPLAGPSREWSATIAYTVRPF